MVRTLPKAVTHKLRSSLAVAPREVALPKRVIVDLKRPRVLDRINPCAPELRALRLQVGLQPRPVDVHGHSQRALRAHQPAPHAADGLVDLGAPWNPERPCVPQHRRQGPVEERVLRVQVVAWRSGSRSRSTKAGVGVELSCRSGRASEGRKAGL